jgi:hypothetical protein
MFLALFARSVLHMEDRAIKVAYAAGFFDGEGHIRIQRHSRRGSYMLQISAVQATECPLPLFQQLFGGTVKKRVMHYRGTLRAQYTWQTSSRSAENALRAMLPYMRVKTDEAELALEFRATFRPQYGERSKNSPELEQRRMAMMFDLQEARKKKRADALAA